MVLALTRNDVYFSVMAVAVQLARRPVVIQDAAGPVDRQALTYEAIASVVGLVLLAGDDSAAADYIPAGVPRIRVELDPQGDVAPVRHPVRLDELDGLIFTSGSTGRPKAIAVASSTPPKFVSDGINRLRMGPEDSVISVSSPSNVGVGVLLTSLLSGARLTLFDFARSGLPGLFRAMSEQKITILSLVPSILRNILQLPGADRAFSTLRALELSGEPMSWSDVALFRSKLPENCIISFAYGSMEVGQVLHWMVEGGETDSPRVPLGFPVTGRRFAILDEDNRPCPVGEPGELVISDRYLALGDWIDGRIDPARFPTDPESGERVYRTGDLVSRQANGLFEFVGRRDRMVKVHGLRADLGEIETILKTAPGVADAAAIAHERGPDEIELVAFLVLHPGAELDRADLRRRVMAAAAPHMAPAAFHRLDEMPTLYNGKPDLTRLKALAAAGGEGAK